MDDRGASTDVLPLFVRTRASVLMLRAGPEYRIGRDPESDIVVTDPRVSWHHAALRLENNSWLLEDSGSTNGTFVGRDRVRQLVINGDCLVRLGHPVDGAELSCSLEPPPGGPRSAGSGGATSPVVPAPSPSAPPVAGPVTAGASAGSPPAAGASVTAGASAGSPPAAGVHVTAGASAGSPPAADAVAAGAGVAAPPRTASAVMSLPPAVLRIGRATDNDVVVADLRVSRYHAELRRVADGRYEIVDLASHNGTFLNGQQITAAPVKERDLIGIGPATFRRFGGELQEFIDTGDISLAARDLTVTVPGGKVLLDRVTFPLSERCLLGVIGPSGAGKSTLLGALTGTAPANGGGVLYDNRDLYTHYGELRHRIGLVPQENILHTQLTAKLALGYAAELRFPRDTDDWERERRITEVLAELSLTKHADTRASALSGGQQKRVNVALELLTKPSLLFLDEPTSGLDPGLDKALMRQMAELAHDGRTVIVVTHSVLNLNLCDRLLVLVPGGRIAFFGPPADGLRHFDQPDWAEVFQAFDAQPDRDWAGEYRRSPYYERYIAGEMSAPLPARLPPATVAPPASRNRFAQLATLCRRYVSVIASDRAYLAVLAIMPLILGGLARAVPSPLGLSGVGNTDAESVLLILVIGACFIGAANAVREVVKERPIYTRERAAGLSAGAYLGSKLVILGVISAVQAALLVVIGLVGRKLPATGSVLRHLPLVEVLLAMALLAIVSMMLGLLISTLVNSSDKTLPLLVVVVMFQVILTGAIFPLAGKTGIEQLAAVSPSRWGFAAVASTANLNVIQQPPGQKAAARTAAVRVEATPASGGGATKATTRSNTEPRQALGSSTVDRLDSYTAATGHKAASGSATGHKTATGHKAAGHKTAGHKATSGSPGVPAVPTDPIWAHKSATWLKDMGAMAVLGLIFSLLTWWRLLRIKPGRRR